MLKNLRKPVAFLSAAAMTLTMLLYLPVATFTSNDYGTFVNADDTTTDNNGFLEDGSYEEPTKITNDNFKDFNLTSSYVGYYAIENAGQLYWFADKVNNDNDNFKEAKAVLTDNIVVNNDISEEDGRRDWTPIGCFIYNPTGYTEKNVYFSGVFDGNSHTISGLYFYNTSQDSVGLFGQITSSAVIKNLGVVNSSITGKGYVGGVCGSNEGTITNCYNTGNVTCSVTGNATGNGNVGGVCGENKGTIENCYNTGTVTASDSYVGGVCGWNYGKITNCYNTGNLTGDGHVGGVCGRNTRGTIENCYNEGTVTGSGNYVGGVCGGNDEGNSKIINCYNTGNVTGTGDYCVGGVCGENEGTIKSCYNTANVKGTCYNVGGVCGKNSYGGTIENCYNTGTVTGESWYDGGVCGYNGGTYNSTITNCYNTGDVSGKKYVGGVCGNNSSSGTITNCYFNSTKCKKSAIGSDSGTKSNVEGKATSAFENGEVAYFLQGEQTEQVWGQNLDVEGKDIDTTPNFTGAKVYCLKPTESKIYSNQEYLAKLTGYTLTLDGTIGVNFHMALSDAILNSNDAYVEFTVNGKTQKVFVSEVKDNTSDGYYVFPCYVASPDMTAEITAQLVCGDYKTEKYTYTVQNYAEYILNNSDDYDAETVALVKALLNYGANAQTYFNKNSDSLANSILEEADKAIQEVTASDFENYKSDIKNNESVGEFVSFHLNLNSVTSIRENFIPAENATDLKFYIGETQLDNDNTKDMYYYKSGEKYVLVMSNINALDLDTAYEFKVSCTVDNDEITSTAKVSTFSYIYAALSQTDEKYDVLKETMKALYGFNQKAEAYSTAQNE